MQGELMRGMFRRAKIIEEKAGCQLQVTNSIYSKEMSLG
jgi:hypothetical protein